VSQLTHSQADIIVQHLINVGQIIRPVSNMPVSAWPGYIDGIPDLPDQVVAVFGTTGARGRRDMKTGKVYSHPGITITVRVRPGQYRIGYRKAGDIATALDEQTWNSIVNLPASGIVPAKQYTIASVSRTAPVLSIGQDTKNRDMFSLNAICFITEET
jgi:hypothetical protein